MQKYSDVVLSAVGAPVSGAVITVTTYPDGAAATIYGADGGPSVASVTTNVNGRFSFYAANGHYSILVSGTGITPVTYNDVVLFDPKDGGDSALIFTPSGTGATKRPTQDKLRDYVTTKDFGAVCDGVADDTAAIQAAINTGRAVKHIGTSKITAPLSLTSAKFYGEGPARSRIYASGCHAFTIPYNTGLSRPACIVEGIGISSPSLNCDDKYAFYVPGVADSAAVVYNSGLTVRDVEIGADGRMGGGFYLKDLFRANIENIGLSNVSFMVRLVGSVVQCKFRNITSNNNSAGTALSLYGVSTESANYSAGSMAPENVRFIDCAAIRCDRGISHTAGLDIEFENFDTEAKYYGAYLNAPCIVRGGIFAPAGSGTAATWVGIYRGSNASDIGGAVVIDGADVNMLTSTTTPSGSYGIDIGDGISPVNGMTVRNCKVRGVANSLAMAIRGRNLNDCAIEDNFVISGVATGNSVNLTGSGFWFDRNRIQWGAVVLSDSGVSNSGGSVMDNQLSTLTFAPTNPNNWKIGGNNGSAGVQNLYGLQMTAGIAQVNNMTLSPAASVTPANNGNMTFQLTSNTSLTIKVKGSDGVVRSTSLTLA